MSSETDTKQLITVGIVAAFATLSFVGTVVIRIPIPVTGGYFNLGDTFVMAAALLYGPWVGALVGLTGPAAADAVGYPQFILATAVIKFCEGGLVGLLAGKRLKFHFFPSLSLIFPVSKKFMITLSSAYQIHAVYVSYGL